MIPTNTAFGHSSSAHRFARHATIVACVVALALVGCGKKKKGEDAGTDYDAVGASCDHDDSTGPEKAVALEKGKKTEGFICPVKDEDWYSVTTNHDRSILSVSLTMTDKLSPIDPTYSVHSTKQGGKLDKAVGSPGSVSSAKEIKADHCVGKGTYKVVVRDEGNDAEDKRRSYQLSVDTKKNPDTAEPNDSKKEAIELKQGQPKTGYIACTGDADWFGFDVPQDRLVQFKVTANKPDFQPKVELLDDNDKSIAKETNQESPRNKTDIDKFVVVPGAGRYFLKVSDDNDEDADVDVPYKVEINFIKDSDTNEPNNTPDKATELSKSNVNCGGNWSQKFQKTGTIGAESDEDWYKIPLNNCGRGIIEAKAELRSGPLSKSKQWKVNQEVQMALALIRPDTKSSCQNDAECTELQRSCQKNLDCARFGDNCLGQGLCAGAGECLPSGSCGAHVVQRNYECNSNFETCSASSGKKPPANKAEFAAPTFGQDFLYLRVNDFQSDGKAPEQVYTLQVRVRKDPDRNEKNNIFVNKPENVKTEDGRSPQSAHRSRAKNLPIYDCTGTQPTQGSLDAGVPSDAPMSMDTAVDTSGNGMADTSMQQQPDTGGPMLQKGCCSNMPWTDGAISYQNDQDWFEYRHPCPGSDCTVELHYRIDGGPVDTAIDVYREGGGGFTGAFDADEKASQPQRNGKLGGTTASDTCFFAYHGHGNKNGVYHYGVKVSDQVDSKRKGEVDIVDPDSRDWSPDQGYSICIQKVSNKCSEPPCKIYMKEPSGCGAP